MSTILRSYHRAIIIGNGFDLNCGYKTSYNDFIESDFFKQIELNNAICQQLKYKIQSNKWIDVENEIKEIYKDDISIDIDYCAQRKKEFIELTEAVNKYMNQIDDNLSSLNTSSFYLTKALGTYNIFNDTYVICFNYTQTIRELIERNKSNGELIMIHGEAKKIQLFWV